jgi:RNA polymerase sigma-70 factor (ECF subfamily)
LNQKNPEHDAGRDGTNDSSFEILVKQARSGDQDAVGILIERYRNYLMFIANDEVDQHLQAKMAASDAVQESILHAQFNFDQFRGDSEPEWKAWLKTILANDIRKGKRQFSTRKRNANLEINLQDQSAVGRSLYDKQRTPSTEAMEREKAKAMELVMNQLSEEQRQVIQLRNFERLAFAEIGLQMQRSEDAARKLWARTIETLKDSIRSASPELTDESQNPGQIDERFPKETG